MSASKLIPQTAPRRSNITFLFCTLTFRLEKAVPITAAPTELSFLRIPPSTWDYQVQETQNCRRFSTLSDCSSQFVLFLFSWVTAVERPARQPRKNTNRASRPPLRANYAKTVGENGLRRAWWYSLKVLTPYTSTVWSAVPPLCTPGVAVQCIRANGPILLTIEPIWGSWSIVGFGSEKNVHRLDSV